MAGYIEEKHTYIAIDRSPFSVGGMSGAAVWTIAHKPRGGRCEPYGKDDLPCGVTIYEGLWDSGKTETLSGDTADAEGQCRQTAESARRYICRKLCQFD